MHGEAATEVDLTARIELCHAALQHLAQRVGADMLHIKGLAAAPAWRSRGLGSDADVLVRPSHVGRVVEALDATWHRRSRFHTGSPFGHAQTYWHDHLGFADVHRFFPGMAPGDAAFDVLWTDRQTVELAQVATPVPSEPGQALAVGVGAAVAGTAYCAAFVMLSAIGRHGMVTGLIYVLVFEGLLASWLSGLRYVSISAFGRRIAEGLDDSLNLVAGNLPLAYVWIASAVVIVAGCYVAGLRLSRFQLRGDE